MCDSMPILDEDFNFNEINLDFLESPPRPKRIEESSAQSQSTFFLNPSNHFNNDGQTRADAEPSFQSNTTRNSIRELAKRIAEVDTLVGNVHKVEKERDDLRKQLEDLHQSAKEVQLLYANEKQKRIEEEYRTKELSQKCVMLDTDLTAKTLEVDQLQAQVDSFKVPIEYNDLVTRYLRLVQQQDGDRPLHWHDQEVVRDLYKYCKEKCLKVQPITQRPPRKRKVSTLKIDAEVQCDVGPVDSIKTVNRELRDKNTQCVIKTRDQGCQHIGTTTTRSTTTACFIKYHDVGVNCNLWDMKYALNEMLNDVRSWSTSVAPLSPIADLNINDDEKTADTSSGLSPNRTRVTKALSPLPPRTELKTVGTCTYICNVQRNVDFVTQPPTIKRSHSRPPSTLMFESVKNENNTRSTPPSPLPLGAFNPQLPPIPQMVPSFDELWQIFGHMLYGLLHRRNGSGVSLANQSMAPSNITNQQEFYNWLQTIYGNIPAAERIQSQSREAPTIGLENSNREECLSAAESLLEHQHSQCNLASPLNFSNVAPVKCTNSGQQIFKPKAQKSNSNITDETTVTSCTERQSIGTSPIRCISSSTICEEANTLTCSNIHQLKESSTSGIVEYNNDSRTPSAFTSPSSTKKPEMTSIYPSQIDETAKKILELFPLVNDRNSTLQSVQNLLRKNWKLSRRQAIENRKRKRLLNSSSESGSETAVDFIAKLDCFIEQKNIVSNNNEKVVEDCSKEPVNTKSRKSGKRGQEKLQKLKNINKNQRRETLECKNVKNLHKLNRSLFGSETDDTESSDDEIEKKMFRSSTCDEEEDVKKENDTENSTNHQNLIKEPFSNRIMSFNDNFRQTFKESQQIMKTNNVMQSDKQQNTRGRTKVQIQSNVPIYTKTKVFSKTTSNSSPSSDFSQIKSSENAKELLQNKMENSIHSTHITPKNIENTSESSNFENSQFKNLEKEPFTYKNKQKSVENCKLSKNVSTNGVENEQYKNNPIDNKDRKQDLMHVSPDEEAFQEEHISSNPKKEILYSKSKRKSEEIEYNKEKIFTNIDNPTEKTNTEQMFTFDDINCEIPNEKIELQQNVENIYISPNSTKEKTSQSLSPFSDTSSTSSIESKLIIVSDVEEIIDFESTPSIAKKRGRKRKSESSSSTNSMPSMTMGPCKRSQRLLAKQKIKEDQFADHKNLILPALKNNTNRINKEKENDLVKENSRNKELSPVLENLELGFAEEDIVAEKSVESKDQELLSEGQEDLNRVIPLDITTEKSIKSTCFEDATDSTDQNSRLSINLDNTFSPIKTISSPESPTPCDLIEEIDEKPVIEIPLELVRNGHNLKRRNKSLLHNIIDNYEASKYRSFNQMLLKSHEEALISQLEAHFKEYFALYTKTESSADELVEFLLATSKDLKLIAHAACASSQEASRPDSIPYENLKNLSVPLLNSPAPSSIYENMKDVMRKLLVQKPEFKDIILAVIESKIFNVQNADTISLNVALNLTDLYLLTLSLQLPQQRENPARLFIGKCLYYHRMKAVPMIYAVLCAFPTTLPHREERKYDRSDPLITVIQHVLMCTNYNMENHELFHRELLSKLRYVYHFEIYKPDFQDVLQNLVEKLRAGKIDNLKYAFAIFCKRQPPERVVRDIIQGQLIPLSNEYYNYLQHSTDYDVRTAALLDCFSSVIKPFPRDCSSPIATEINNYVNIFKRFLSIVDRPIVQEAALHAILRLQRFSNVNCYNALSSFKPNYDLSPYTQAAIKTFIHRKPLSFWKTLLTQSG